MKKLFIIIMTVFSVTFVSAQDTKLEKLTENYYQFTENSITDAVHQTGFYEDVNGQLIRDGVWKHYINGELVSTAVYKNDKLTNLVIDGVEYSYKDLKILRLENKIRNLVADNK